MMELEKLKEAVLRDLNSEDYPFVVEIKGNTVIARWKTKQLPEDIDEKRKNTFSVKYKLRKDGTFCGGEMTVRRDDYTPPTSTERRSVFSISSSDNLPWRKKVDKKEWKNIGYDEKKLYSILEHYLLEQGLSYRPGAWNHAYLSWNQGFYFRIVGALFLIVGAMLFIGALDTKILAIELLPWIHIIVGAWLLLIGLGKIEFYDLRPKIAVRVICGIIIGGWVLVFAFMILEFVGVPILP